MPFLIDATDKPDSGDLRARTRPEHMEFLKASLPKLLAAGAKLRDDGTTAFGSAYIVDVDTRAEAEAFINADPFTKAGLFGSVNITRWRKGFFDYKAM